MLLALLGLGKALALIGIATALASGIVSAINDSNNWKSALWLGGGSAVLRAAIAWATEVVSTRAAAGEKEALRVALTERVLARGGRDLDEGQGALAVLATRGLDDLDDYFTRYLPALMTAMTVPVVVGIRIFFADWVSALIVAITLPLVPIFMILIGTYIRDRVSEATDSLTRLANHLVELARGLPVLVGLGRAGDQKAALREISERHRERTMATLRIAFLSALALELIATISVAVVAVFVGVRLVHGTLDLETGLLVLILAPDCFLPLREVGSAHHAAQNGMEALRRVRNLIARPISKLIPATSENEGILELRNLTVQYSNRTEPSVSNLSFAIPAGSMVLLEGPSGSGKSTAIAAIAGLLGNSPDQGTLVSGEMFGIDRDRIAWVSQHPKTVAPTVREEIEQAIVGDQSVAIDGVLERLGISQLSERHPGELSPGELRRVAMARAVIRVESGANLLLLDEPTAHLDVESAERIIVEISAMAGRVTILAASHDPAIRQLANRTVALRGAIASDTDIHRASTVPGSTDVSPIVPESEPAIVDASAQPGVWATFRLLIDLLNLRQPKAVLALLCGALAALSAVALTSLSGWLIVRASEQPPILMLMVVIVGVRFFGIGRAVFRYLERLAVHDIMLNATIRLRVRIWDRLAAQGPAMRRLLRSDSAIDSFIGDVDRLRDLAPRVLFPPFVGALTGLVVLIAMALILPATIPVMGALLLITLLIAPAITHWADRRDSALLMETRSLQLRRFTSLFGAAADVRVNGLASTMSGEAEDIESRLRDSSRRSAWARGAASALVTVACVFASLAMIWVSRGPNADSAISTEMVAVLALTPLTLIEPMLAVSTAIQQLPALMSVTSRFGWLTKPSDATERPEQVEIAHPSESIELDSVSAQWPAQAAPVFEHLSLAASRGEWVSVTGPSGSGKSTLLAVLMAFLRPVSGGYRINGANTQAFSGASIRNGIAWCPQEAFLFASTLRANLLIARSRNDPPAETEMRDVLSQVGLGELLREMPDGLDTRIGAEGSFLSGGERQRVAIARALLARADMILIDEPTAHLDRATADLLMSDLRKALCDRLVITVTHNPNDIETGDLQINLGFPLSASVGVSSMMPITSML
jgi:ATP-binding cassette subfamily C protein CydCD